MFQSFPSVGEGPGGIQVSVPLIIKPIFSDGLKLLLNILYSSWNFPPSLCGGMGPGG